MIIHGSKRRRPPLRSTADGKAQGGSDTYREALFELVDGRAATPLFAAFIADRSARTRIQALSIAHDAATVLFDHAGPASSVARVRDIIVSGAQPCVLHADVLADTEKHIRFIVTWSRPSQHSTQGVSLEHLLHDAAGHGALLFGRVDDGVISYKAASPAGKGLAEFLAAAQRAFGGRFTVRPVRAGPFKPGWEIDDAPRHVDPEEEALLSAALAHGYYDEPKRCGVRELGDALGVSKSVVARRLRDLEKRALERMVS